MQSLSRQALIPTPRRPSPRLLLAALGTSLGLNLVLANDGGSTSTPAPAERIAPVAPTAPAPVVAPAPVAPLAAPCDELESDPDPARWTIGPDHVGPLSACELHDPDLAAVRALIPAGLDVTEIEGPDRNEVVVSKDGRPLLSVLPTDPVAIIIRSATIATPWGTRVGDRIRDVRARHRDLRCIYGAAEGEESLWCERSGDTGDGWVDTFGYGLDPRRLSRRDRAVLETGEELPAARLDDLVVGTIVWHATSS